MYLAGFKNFQAGAAAADVFAVFKGTVTMFSADLGGFAKPLCLLAIDPEDAEILIQEAEARADTLDDILRVEPVINHSAPLNSNAGLAFFSATRRS
jgi:hypothetical protein